MRIDHENPEIPEPVVSGGRQRKTIADPVARLVRAGDHVEGEREVRGGARHRPDDGQIALARHGWRRRQAVSAQWDQAEARLVSEHTAEMRRYPDRAADVRADRE